MCHAPRKSEQRTGYMKDQGIISKVGTSDWASPMVIIPKPDDQVIQGLPKTLSYSDNIIIHDITKAECYNNLEMFLQRLKKYDLPLNKNK
ncbi:hypothetical protein CEXT_372821 [Caerostris extrusa]|uniref:Reverse transcriptase domain-containing protein n=1 Tax=Caerostris extrusa TaxID=172846 RepID=A0AAV4NCX6_CAEEX|nr:hypothetical protein CEXT_372821 [Caerostris extrusa]